MLPKHFFSFRGGGSDGNDRKEVAKLKKERTKSNGGDDGEAKEKPESNARTDSGWKPKPAGKRALDRPAVLHRCEEHTNFQLNKKV
jgi:hypothetical protein